MTEELVKQETKALQITNAYDDSDIPTDMMIIPRVSLLQANSPAVAEDGDKLGTYKNGLTKENYGPVLDFIPLRASMGAIFFSMDEGLKCRSNDGIISIKGDSCIKCPFGEYYGNWKTGKQPRCKNTLDILGFDGNTMHPFVITFKSMSLACGKKLVSLMKSLGKPLLVKLGASLKTNDAGQRYFIMDMKALLDPTPVQLDAFVKFKEQFKKVKIEFAGEEDDTKHSD
jgi:hypothetical protein